MKKQLFICIKLLLASLSLNAQFLAATEVVSGVPLTSKSSGQTDNTPYLHNETFNGSVKFANQKSSENLALLYDLNADVPLAVDKQGRFLKFNELPIEFSYSIPGKGTYTYKRDFPAIDKFAERDFYEVLIVGKIQLLKKTRKSFTESIPYGSATLVKKAVYADFYYLFDGKTMTRIKKDTKSLAEKLKEPNLSHYYKENKNKFATEEDLMIAIVEEHNKMN
ncbi:hypothetical protein [Pedobacter xixiisoli]|uniref:GLPGLI family protein n=1 Tax=Pedobacter xixiisoli TaxID=1476464 RepID=A0A286ADR9_9SPHI|nr:hypothetical protein [Pedobacter xixiisoli]SOD20050.1 hypothetical protein SAMN06297358_3759 [Pedobacter xixiisoli]